jgi:hypothetical protein
VLVPRAWCTGRRRAALINTSRCALLAAQVAVEVMEDLTLDVFPRFLKSIFFQKYIRTKWMETKSVTTADFQVRFQGRLPALAT